MKRRWIWLITALVLTSLLGGCGLLNGNYVSIEPHGDENMRPNAEIDGIFSYEQLRETLVSVVEDGIQRKVISVETINPSYVPYYMDAAIQYVTENCAIGAYFVDTIRYETGTNAGQAAIVVDITYKQGPTNILRLNRVDDMDDAAATVTAALDDCASGTVFLIEDYRETDFLALIRAYALMYPQRVVEIPQTTVSIYPEAGTERIVELTFTYENEQTELQSMQDRVRALFASARSYAEGADSDSAKFLRLYSFLMERYDYASGQTGSSVFNMLFDGVGNEETFACVYAAMCRQVGLDCRTISGTKDGKPWVWNAITVDGVSYYIDLVSSYYEDGFRMMRPSEMGAYTWNPDAQELYAAQP